MIEKLLAVKPYKFVPMEHNGNSYWGVEYTDEFKNSIPIFHRFVICADHFTLRQLKKIQTQAIEQDESDEIRHWIYQAMAARQELLIKKPIAFYWNDEGDLTIYLREDEESSQSLIKPTVGAYAKVQLENLLEVAIGQDEPENVIAHLKYIIEQRKNNRHH